MDIREEQELRETMPKAKAIGPEQVRRLTEQRTVVEAAKQLGGAGQDHHGLPRI